MITSWLQKNALVVSVTLLTITFITALLIVTDTHSNQDDVFHVWIPDHSNNKNVSRNFLSVALDSGLLASGRMIKILESHTVLKLAKYLSPGYLRIGGNAADVIIFQENGTKETSLPEDNLNDFNLDCFSWDYPETCPSSVPPPPIILTGKEWLAISHAAQSAGLTLVFDLNVLLRTHIGRWNSSNARELLRFSSENNISAVWQLGNEPNAFYHKFGVRVSPEELGNDFNRLKRMLAAEKIWSKPLLVGPDVTRPLLKSLEEESTTFLKNFLRVAGKSLDAVTWHQYYLNGRTATLNDFVNVTHFDDLPKQIGEVKRIVAWNTRIRVPIWLSETASAYGGGAPGLSDRFVASFLWLDKLGVAARDGVDVVIKQALVGGNYGLIHHETLKPLPLWWVSLLYKQLVGTQVLSVYMPSAVPEFRVYSHRSTVSHKDVVLFGVNFAEKATKMAFINSCTRPYLKQKYILTAPEDDLTSDSILLNGNLLSMEPDGSLPPLLHEESWADTLTLPPYSLFFIVLENYGIDC